MDTQFTVTYQIDSLADGLFTVNEEYQARYHYKEGATVTEIQTTVAHFPPRSQAWFQVRTDWHDEDHDNFNYEPEEE